MWIFWKQWALAKNAQVWLYRGWYFPSNVDIPNVILSGIDINFQGQTFQVATLTSKHWKNTKLLLPSDRKYRYLPLNGTTANVVHHELDLMVTNLETFWKVNISKMVRASKKMLRFDFYTGWYLPSNGTIANVALHRNLTYFSSSNISNAKITEIARVI